MKALFVMIAAIFTLSGCAAAGDATARIEARNQALADALNAGDSGAAAALYTADATILPPGSAVVRGPDNIAAHWQGVIDAGLKVGKLQTDEVFEIDGDNLVEVGNYELYSADGELAGAGHYVVYWRKADGKWFLYRDIYN